MATQPFQSLTQLLPQGIAGPDALGLTTNPIVITVKISPNQLTSLVPGQAVKFDAAVTAVGVPNIIACAQNAYADGYVLYDAKNGGATSLSPLQANNECLMLISGVQWFFVNSANVVQGQVIEDSPVAGGVEPLGTTVGAFPRGIAIDYGATGSIVRCLMMPAAAKICAAAA